MKSVWKFSPTHLDDVVQIDMPRGAKILHVDDQGGNLCLWALVDTDAPVGPRLFRIAGTGHEIITQDTFHPLGTVLLGGGRLVFHVFDLGEKPR